jgi:hypothetical protein
MRHHLGAHWIQHHIPAELEQVCVFFDENRGEPPLKEMPDPMMPTAVGLGIPAVQLAHAQRQISLRRFDEQMIVVVHQTVRVAAPSVPIDDMGEQREPLRPIAVIVHNVLPGIAPTGEVIDGAGELKTKRTGHDTGVYPSECVIARPDPASVFLGLDGP